MADLLYLFGNSDEVLTNFNELESGINIENKSFGRPKSLFSQNNDLNHSFNDFNKLTNGVKYSLSPEDVHQKFISTKLRSLSCLDLPNELPPENPKGNIEYKRQLLNLSSLRTKHLTTQLKWRLAEGGGEAIYEIGVDDDGTISGLHKNELVESVCNLCRMAESLNAEVIVLREGKIGKKKALELLVRNLPSSFPTQETRVALLGGSDSGKSTLVGVMTQGELDNGRGKTRLLMFRHLHEVRSGRTSSVSSQLLGFDESGHRVTNLTSATASAGGEFSQAELVLRSARLVSLLDLAGSAKYQRITLFALTAKRPHLGLLTLPVSGDGNVALTGVGLEHCRLALAFQLPLVILVTKLDICPRLHAEPGPLINQLWPQLFLHVYHCRSSDQQKVPIVRLVTRVADAQQLASLFLESRAPCIPLIPVSCVSGLGIDVLTAFLAGLDPSHKQQSIQEKKEYEQLQQSDSPSNTPSQSLHAEVWIDQVLRQVPRVDGCVVAGLIHEGTVDEGNLLHLGPQKDGSFLVVRILSIHRNRLQQRSVHKGQYASFAVNVIKNCLNYDSSGDDQIQVSIEKGMVLLSKPPRQNLDYGVGLCLRSMESGPRSRLAWGLLVDNMRLLLQQQQSLHDDSNTAVEDVPVTSRDLARHGQSWVLHCGNVCHKCTLILPASQKNDSISWLRPNDDVAIFRFARLPQWIHPNCRVVFHKPGKQIRAYGNICGVLGSRLCEIASPPSPGSEKKTHKSGHKPKPIRIPTFSLGEDDSDDEYVTAPTSPVLLVSSR